MPLGAMKALIKRRRCETGPSASGSIHCQNFTGIPGSGARLRGADKQPGTTIGRRVAEIDPLLRDACRDDPWFAR